MSSLLCIDEIAIGGINGIEGKTCEVHCHEIKVHALDTTYDMEGTFC